MLSVGAIGLSAGDLGLGGSWRLRGCEMFIEGAGMGQELGGELVFGFRAEAEFGGSIAAEGAMASVAGC
jgi:hypothetical protein